MVIHTPHTIWEYIQFFSLLRKAQYIKTANFAREKLYFKTYHFIS